MWLANPDLKRPGLWIALGLYLALGLAGIHYGLPVEHHPLSFDADETTWLAALSRIQPSKIDPAPELITPTFYLEMYGATVGIAGLTGWIPIHESKEWFRTRPEIFGRFYLAGRYLQIICGVLLLWVLWEWARQMWGVRVASAATLFLSACPSFIAASHFSQANIPVTLLACGALACLWHDEQSEGTSLRWLVWGSFLSGLAISTKYSAFPLLVVVAYQLRLRLRQPAAMLGAVAGGVGGFFCGTPFSIIHPRTFFSTFLVIKDANLNPIAASLWTKWTFPLAYPLPDAMGPVLLFFGILGFLIEALKSRGKNVLVIWIITFYMGAVAAGSIASPGRVLIALPVLALLAARSLDSILGAKQPVLFYGLSALIFLLTLPFSLAIVALHRHEPIPITASRWIQDHIPTTASIGIPHAIQWWTPPAYYESVHHADRLENPYHVINLEFSPAAAKREKPAFIILSGAERTNVAHLIPNALPFLQWLDSGSSYRQVMYFPRRLTVGPWEWHRPERILYTDDDLWDSTLEVYQRLAPPTS